MRTIVIIGFAVGLLATALPAQAADTNANASNASANRSNAPAREQPQAGSSNADERQVCVREARSESRIRRPVCHTAREWREIHGDPSNDG